jgi:hypothetical protein
MIVRIDRLAASLLLLLPLAACEFGEVGFFDLPAPEELSLSLVLRAEHAESGAALGWADGRIPDADVRITSADSSWIREVRSDGDGAIFIDAVPVGGYRVEVSRLLTEAERAAAAATGAVAFIHSAVITVAGGAGTQELFVPASRRRSVVFSELRYTQDLTNEGTCCYRHGTFIEIYNNADSTVYLDGKVMAEGFFYWHDIPPFHTCELDRHVRIDPRGIWVGQAEQFPGSGTDYPLLPGQIAVIALDAIDHRPFAPTAHDLSAADFESRGLADVDNPSVPDMIDVGLRYPPEGHGLIFRHATFVLAEPVVVRDLPRTRDAGGQGIEWALVPADRILDVVLVNNPALRAQGFPECSDFIHPAHHQGRPIEGLSGSSANGRSLQRRPLLTLPDGRVVLQHTRASTVDFMVAPDSPGALPAN